MGARGPAQPADDDVADPPDLVAVGVEDGDAGQAGDEDPSGRPLTARRLPARGCTHGRDASGRARTLVPRACPPTRPRPGDLPAVVRTAATAAVTGVAVAGCLLLAGCGGAVTAAGSGAAGNGVQGLDRRADPRQGAGRGDR